MRLIDKISLAALLHDIGKFYQRTGLEIKRPGNWHDYIPKEYSYPHALYTYRFFEENEGVFNEGPTNDETALINLAARHHNPSNPYESIIAVADRLSAGLDRKHYDKLGQEEDVKRFRCVRLKPIFEEISLKRHDCYKEEFLYPLVPFSPEKIFPQEKSLFKNLKGEKCQEEYQRLWHNFERDFKRIKYTNFNTFFNAVRSLLEVYTWCIPSATIKTVPDIPLYDHLTTTAAIATALFGYYEAKGQLQRCSLNYLEHTQDKPFVFIVGDFSGIQSFIFDQGGSANKYAAKILRAKSFFVSLATETAAYLVIQKFGLNPASILSTAAGKFLVLAPNLDNIDEHLQELKQEIRRTFHKRFYGEVNFCLAWLRASTEEFKSDRYASFMTNLALKLEEEKLSPLDLDPQLFVFNDYLDRIRSSEDICAICGKHPKTKQIDDEMPICEDCLAFKEIGERLVKEEFITLGENLKYRIIGNYGFEFGKDNAAAQTGLVYQLSPETGFKGYPLKHIAKQVPKFKANEWQEKRYKDLKKEKLPQDYKAGSIKTFYHLACDALTLDRKGNRIGSPFLGIFKADVDNLGLIFKEGLKRDQGQLLTASRYAYLSRMLDAFFSLYIPYIATKRYPEIYTVFTGGDDLFLIGPYTQIYQFAQEEIGTHFKRYVCHNEDITISAGLILAKPMVPVRQMAEEAERALEASKQRRDKNAITIFQQTLDWKEFKNLSLFEAEIDQIEQIEPLPTAYFYRLLTLSDWAEKMSETPQFAKWRAIFAYITARNFGKKPYYERLLDIGNNWIEAYKSKLTIPLSIAIYKRRKRK